MHFAVVLKLLLRIMKFRCYFLPYWDVSLQDLRASGCCSSDGDPRRHVVLGRTEKQRSWLIQGVSSSLHTGIMDQHTCTSADSHTLAYFSYCFSTECRWGFSVYIQNPDQLLHLNVQYKIHCIPQCTARTFHLQ